MPDAPTLFDLLDEPAPAPREEPGCPAVWHSTSLGRTDRCLRTFPHWSHRGLFAEWMPDAEAEEA